MIGKNANFIMAVVFVFAMTSKKFEVERQDEELKTTTSTLLYYANLSLKVQSSFYHYSYISVKLSKCSETIF